MRMRIWHLLPVALGVAVASAGARAQSGEDCAALAGTLGAGADAELVAAAREACSDAARANPGSAELLFLYGRTLALSGEHAAAARLYLWAIEDGHPLAAQALARLADGTAADTEQGDTAAPDAAPVEADVASDTQEPTAADDFEETDASERREGLAALLDQVRSLLPHTAFDVQAVVATVGIDAQALTEWVGTQTVLIPYRGRLRGAAGVLTDRFGNSLDRALLLAALLETAGYRTALVRGTLPEEDASRLLAPRPSPPPPPEGPGHDAVLAALGIDTASDSFGVIGSMEALAADGAALRARVAAEARAVGDALLELVASYAQPASQRAAEIAALQDHWWVRVAAPGGGLDLDPSGLHASAAGATEIAPDGLPTELSHTVLLTVVAEMLEPDGSLRSEALLSHPLAPADLAGAPVLLRHTADGRPVLQVGGEVVAGHVTDTGATLVAEWLAFETRVPGQEPDVHRHPLFDLIGPASRAAGGPLHIADPEAAAAQISAARRRQVAIHVAGASPSPTQVADAAARALAATLRASAEPSRGDLSAAEADLLAFAAARAGVPGDRPLVLDRPNIVLVSHDPQPEDGAGAPGAVIAIIDNTAAQIAAPAAGAFAARLRQGVADTLAASALLGTPDAAMNTARLFAADLAGGRRWVALAQPGEAAAMAGPNASAVARIEAAIAAGRIVVLPESAERADTWWEVDAQTGTTVGVSIADGIEVTDQAPRAEAAWAPVLAGLVGDDGGAELLIGALARAAVEMSRP
jgi:hypothetical protein